VEKTRSCKSVLFICQAWLRDVDKRSIFYPSVESENQVESILTIRLSAAHKGIYSLRNTIRRKCAGKGRGGAGSGSGKARGLRGEDFVGGEKLAKKVPERKEKRRLCARVGWVCVCVCVFVCVCARARARGMRRMHGRNQSAVGIY
jgi:hypothetical protein